MHAVPKMPIPALFLLLAISTEAFSAHPELYRCPDHLTNYIGQHLVKIYNGRCYEFFDAEKRWVDARDYCRDIAPGGQLIEIPDAATMNWVKTELYLLPWKNNGVWNGANDRSDEGTWKWLSGVRLSDSFSYWASNQPNRGWLKRINDCAVMKRGDGWRWRDVNCNIGFYKYKFICQFDMTDPTTSPTTSSTTSSTTTSTTSSTRSFTTRPTTRSTTRSTTRPTTPMSSLLTAGVNSSSVTEVKADRHQVSSGLLGEAHLLGLVIGGILLVLILIVLVAALLFRSRRQKQLTNSRTQAERPLPAQPNPVYYERSSESTFVSGSPYDEVLPYLGGFSGVAPPPYLEKELDSKDSLASASSNLQAAGGHLNPVYDELQSLEQPSKFPSAAYATSVQPLSVEELANQIDATNKATNPYSTVLPDCKVVQDAHYDKLPPARPIQRK